ncbi:hypothetical protein [Pseudorhodoferax sp. Leaf274]|uniref:hypothetical protein n=1 Tax=Pseudorhodoferax sp. Leaf274 TaxID=1736318 RepID=UPI000702F394|nr:hypothetical protein [Pseudorhodoferax sp. Leaf274]KQP49230.1 Asp/Glu/hydantoin racemase [Pseudorhodoferax sp. Leaf274]
MRPHIAFLHTSAVHVETFGQLVKAADATLRVEHVVAEDLLAQAQRVGADDPALVARVQLAMAHAASSGAALVVCTCSTIGGAAERTPTGAGFAVARIDRAMADRAVARGPRVLLVAALESTLAPTAALIRESATALGVQVALETLLVDGAWPHFLQGDRTAYAETVAAAVRAAAPGADVVVLAQASMAPAVQWLGDLGMEVLSSPALGVQSALACLRRAR